MALSNQKKIALCTLTLYWPVLFVLTHIPIPRVIRQADVSDKSLHFLTYLVLTFLLLSVLSDDRKVNWRRVMPWLVLFVIVLYGIFDELLQGYVSGRSSDVRDFIFDLAGVLTGLILSSFLMFWPAGLVITAIFIFGITNVTRTNLADILPVTNAVFHLLAFAILTVQWIQCLHLFIVGKVHQGRRLILAVAMPTGFLIIVTLFSVIAGREFTPSDIIISFGAIMAVVTGFYIRRSAKHSTLQ
jgi:VanZ family protein